MMESKALHLSLKLIVTFDVPSTAPSHKDILPHVVKIRYSREEDRHAQSLKSDIVGVFIAWKSASPINRFSFQECWL